MNDGMLVVNFAALSQASADITNALSKLEADLAQLEQDGNRLMSTWDGTAQRAYHERQTAWRNAADDLSAILLRIRGALNDSTSDYMNTEKKATNLFS